MLWNTWAIPVSGNVLLDRDRGKDRSSPPPTPPYVRIRIRRFDWLCYRCSRVLGFSPRPGRLGPFRFAPRSFTSLCEREGQVLLPFRPHFTHEIRYLLTSPIVQAFAPSPELLCPLLT